jgi:hypothetical protein
METPSSTVPVPPPASMPLNAIYINSFASGVSATDIFVVLQRNGFEIGILNMPYSTGKALAEALTAQLKELETKLGQKIPTPFEIVSAINKTDK